jgi:hypothetical protein
MKITAVELKACLLHYYRFKRQCIAVDEFHCADIIADNGKEIIEVEIKVSKSDLLNGEKKKFIKHHNYKQGNGWGFLHPNRYLFCVPEKLVDVALEYAKELNPNYGVIGFDSERFLSYAEQYGNPMSFSSDFMRIAKSAKKLHEGYTERQCYQIAKRASAKVASMYCEIVNKKYCEILNKKLRTDNE